MLLHSLVRQLKSRSSWSIIFPHLELSQQFLICIKESTNRVKFQPTITTHPEAIKGGRAGKESPCSNHSKRCHKEFTHVSARPDRTQQVSSQGVHTRFGWTCDEHRELLCIQ